MGLNPLSKVKSLARAGWRGGVKPAIKKSYRVGKKTAIGVAKTAGKEVLSNAKTYANAAANTAIRGVGAGASALSGNPGPSIAAEVGIRGKDMLLQKYFGAQKNKGSSHSGKNYAVIRKPAVRYPVSSSRIPGARLPRPMPSSGAAALRNSNHVYSSGHPTGAKI